MPANIVRTTEELLAPILKHKDLELVDVEYVKEGSNWYLRVYIDKENGLDITDCSDVSETLSKKLDEADPIKGTYYLEVSSPGAERPLKTRDDFHRNIHKNIYVTLYEPINGEKAYEGKLESFTNDVVTIAYTVKGKEKWVEIPYGKIAKARLAIVL